MGAQSDLCLPPRRFVATLETATDTRPTSAPRPGVHAVDEPPRPAGGRPAGARNAPAASGRPATAITPAASRRQGPPRSKEHPMSRTPKLASLALAAASIVSVSAGTAQAAPAGFVVVAQCSSLTGTVTYTPALHKRTKLIHETITGTVSGCSGEGMTLSGTGSFSASLSGNATTLANNESGTFVINWPSFFNPTTGTIHTTGPTSSQYAVSGQSTGGAFTGGVLGGGWFVTGQKLTGKKDNQVASETFVNTKPITISRNLG